MKAVIDVQDCRDCPYRQSHYHGHGECWDYCSHPNHGQGPYGDILWGCGERFKGLPTWCPIIKGERKESNNAEFSKGPWAACILNIKKDDIGEYTQRCVDNSPGNQFFFVSVEKEDGPADICHVGNGPTSEKNAFLIAAAPDLYNALLEVTKYYSDQGTGNIFHYGYGNDGKKERMVRNALKKARGEK